MGDARPRAAEGRGVGEILVAENHRTAARLQAPGDDAQQRCLPGAVAAEQADHFARRDAEVDAVQHREQAVAGRHGKCPQHGQRLPR